MLAKTEIATNTTDETKPVLMNRTTSGLRSVLMDEIDKLRNGKTTAKHAAAVSRLASATLASVRVEIDAASLLLNNKTVIKSIDL